MQKIAKETRAGQQYAAAHDAHYKEKDLAEALGQYRAILDAHPETREAEYSRSQIQNIVSSVVPEQEIFDARVRLALIHVASPSSSTIEGKPSAPSVADSPGEAT